MPLSPALAVTHNARDLGALPLTGGGTTRSGVLFRSDALDKLSPAGVAALNDLGIGTVIDLRTENERHRSPDAVPQDSGVSVIPLPVQGGAMDELAGQFLPTDGQASALTDEQVQGIVALIPSLDDLYVAILGGSAPVFATIARGVIDADSTATPGALVHCTAGKDRTGLAAAILLSVAGVTREAIVADYTATEGNLAGPFADGLLGLISALGLPIVPALRTLATESPAHAIEAALDWLDAQHGGAAGYLEFGGLTSEETARLCTILRGTS